MYIYIPKDILFRNLNERHFTYRPLNDPPCNLDFTIWGTPAIKDEELDFIFVDSLLFFFKPLPIESIAVSAPTFAIWPSSGFPVLAAISGIAIFETSL